MAVYRINEETLVGIADSIRSATGKSGEINVSDISGEITAIAGSGSSGGVETCSVSIKCSTSDISIYITC